MAGIATTIAIVTNLPGKAIHVNHIYWRNFFYDCVKR